MCEGKFLVRTRVTDNVIRQVTVENFRFGVRVIKKSEGYWSCQDLNQSNSNKLSKTVPSQSPKGTDKDGTLMRNNLTTDTSLLYSSNSISITKCRVPEKDKNSLVEKSSSFKDNTTDILVDKQRQTVSSKEAGIVDISCSLLNNTNNSQRIKNPSSDSKTQLNGYYYTREILSKPPSIRSIRETKEQSARGTEKQSLKYPGGTLGTNRNKKISTKTQEFNSQYLSKYLGTSPLLKLQLLNLLVVPVDGHQQQGCHELIPLGTISSLKSMLFDDDGSERSGSGSGHETIHENIRPRDITDDGDQLDKKRVKIEMEEDDLVIDENAVDGEDIISEESSIESNLEGAVVVTETNVLETNNCHEITPSGTTVLTTTTTTTTTINSSNNNSSGPASIEKRSNSSSSVTSSHGKSSSRTSITKNGHDGRVSTKVNQQNRKYTNNNNNATYEDCNNTTSNNSKNNKVEKDNSSTTTSAASMVLRLEKEIVSLTTLLKIKEREWNAIIRLKKLKEMALEFMRRQQEVEQLNDSTETTLQNSEDLATLLTKINSETELGPGETQTRLCAEKTEKEIKEEEKKLKNYRIHDESAPTTNTTSSSSTTTSTNKKETSKDSTKSNDSSLSSAENFKASLALQQLCERNRSSSLLHSSGGSPTTVQNNSTSGVIQNKVIGEGRQGTIVEVRSIIADYRSKNPEEVAHSPSQDRKKAARRGTSSSTASTNNVPSIMPQHLDISFKDVLVKFAQLSQSEKLAASISSPQENVTMNARGVSKSNNATMMQATAFGSQRGLGTTLAKLLSSNSSVSVPVSGIAHSSDETSSIAPLKSDKNHMNDSSSLSLASLLASSSKGRDDALPKDDEDNAPICQGCKTNLAQFVCAGCANQWYCSRECQIGAWDDHSEVCSG